MNYKTAGWGELHLSEDPAVELLQSLGYTYVATSPKPTRRSTPPSPTASPRSRTRGDGRKSHTARFLDFDRPNRSEWILTRQYKVLGSKKRLTEKLGRTPTPQDILLHGLVEPRNLLDLVRSFVVFEVEGGRTVRKLARYKQFIAVNEAMRRIRTARKPSARGGIVWHTQGRGRA